MRRFTPVVAVAAIAAIQLACSGMGGEPLSPPTAPDASRGGNARGVDVRSVVIQDACDPTTFNAVLGAGGCTRSGGMKFDQFIAQLTKHQSVGAWHFAPPNLNIRLGQSFSALNKGGETHTFTEVEEYGGGIVPLLNDLSGNPEVAPECAALAPSDFLPPGATFNDTPDAVGTEKYQCCIHPWMRATVTIRS
jgi:hypothetical protein